MMEMDSKPGWNKAAVASLVIPAVTIGTIGVLGSIQHYFPVPSLDEFVLAWPWAGLALSILGLVSYRRGQQGIMMAVCGLILNGVVLILMDPGLHSQSYWRGKSCASNLKQVGNALVMYEQDYDGHLPPRGKWNKAVYDATKSKSILICPEDESGKVSYAINRVFINLDITKIDGAAETIMLYECTPGENRVGGVEIAEYRHDKGENIVGGIDLAAFRHERGCNVGYADGHIKWLSEKDFRTQMDRKVILKSTKSTHAQQSKRQRHEETGG